MYELCRWIGRAFTAEDEEITKMSRNCCSPDADRCETTSGHPAEQSPEQGAAAAPGRAARAACPTCGQAGRPVDPLTVKALLNVPLTDVRDVPYRFCRTAECSTVYYAVDGQQTFDEAALRERVHQKHLTQDAVFVCYCFRHTPGSIRAELRETGRSTVAERITAGIKAGQCACEIRNPQGTCCLGNVQAVVKRARAQQVQVAQTAASHRQSATARAPG